MPKIYKTVAVLCCARNSIYKSMPQADCYDITRDVRTFAGPLSVIAHPPCRAWSAFCSQQAKPPPGEKEMGPLCVEHLKRWGGILEHPAHSRLFKHCGLPLPGEEKDGLWTAEVHQAWWGYPMMKKTWLCFSGIERSTVTFPFREHHCSSGEGDRRRQQRMSKNQRAATCASMATWLVEHASRAFEI